MARLASGFLTRDDHEILEEFKSKTTQYLYNSDIMRLLIKIKK